MCNEFTSHLLRNMCYQYFAASAHTNYLIELLKSGRLPLFRRPVRGVSATEEAHYRDTRFGVNAQIEILDKYLEKSWRRQKLIFLSALSYV